MIAITYNGYSLQNGTIVTTETDLFSPPKRDVQVDRLAHADGGRIVQQFWNTRDFTVSGHIQADGQATLHATIDQFNAALSQQNGILNVTIDGGTSRIIYCTAQELIIAKNRGNTTAAFTAHFISADGMMWDSSSTPTTLLAATTVTAGSVDVSTTVLGSYKAQPLIRYVLNSFTGSGARSVTLSNSLNLKGITISRTWTAGDVLEVDCINMLVYVNSVSTDYTGQFPEFTPGITAIRCVDNFTARNATLSATYTQRWL